MRTTCCRLLLICALCWIYSTKGFVVEDFPLKFFVRKGKQFNQGYIINNYINFAFSRDGFCEILILLIINQVRQITTFRQIGLRYTKTTCTWYVVRNCQLESFNGKRKENILQMRTMILVCISTTF